NRAEDGEFEVRFSAAMTAERLLPQRLALRIRPLLGRIDTALFSADARGEAGRMSVIAFAIRIVSAVIAFASQVMMARWMGSFEYGIFVLVWVTMVIVGNIACLGFHTSVIRFIPEYIERGIICLPMIAMGDLLQGHARAYSWALSALSPTYIVRPVLILVIMAAALLWGCTADAKTAILATIAATYATTLVQLIGVTARIDARVPSGPAKIHLAQWLVVSLPIFLVESFFFLLTNADVLMVGAYLDPDDVAIYFATVKTLALVHFVYFSVKAGVAQRYAQFTHGEPDKLAAFARETVSWTFWPSLFMALLVLALGKPMLMLFGPEFSAGYPLLFLLVFGVVARAAVGPCESLLTMSGNQNICAGVYAMTLTLNIGLNVLMIPLFGLWGAAVATAFAMIFEATALSFTVWRKLGIVMAIFVPATLSKRGT